MKPERHISDRDARRFGPVGAAEPAPRVLRMAESAPLRAAGAGKLEVSAGRLKAADEPLKCVWSGYPDYDRDCRSRIPASVAVKAWQREMQLKGTVEGFFYFSWRSGVWLAFGSADGAVRGVYCPTHCSERDARGAQTEKRRTEGPTGIALQ